MGNKRKVVIIGAGIAGLSAGVYALRSGFEAVVLESHAIPGGNSTSWRRKGYFFEGGMHWLIGSSSETPLNRLWRETGALAADTPIYYRDPFLTADADNQRVCLYRDTDKLREHLLALSPKDRPAIEELCDDVKRFSQMAPPVSRIAELGKASAGEYAARFRHVGIRLLLENIVGGDYNAVALLFTLGSLASGDGGYPMGGSLSMARRMAEHFEARGGVIRYNYKAKRVSVGEDGKADGVYTDNERITGDAVIVTVDARTAIDTLFNPPLHELWADALRAELKPSACTFIGLGISADLSSLSEHLVFPLKRPLEYAETLVSSLCFNNYAVYTDYAPSGCSSLTLILKGDTYDYWKTQRENGRYEARKTELAQAVIDRLEEQFPALRGRTEVWDIATPLTYERYCGTYRGSFMSVWEKNTRPQDYPGRSESIASLYFAGQRIQASGGLPVAVSTGRQAVQFLCADMGTSFDLDGI